MEFRALAQQLSLAELEDEVYERIDDSADLLTAAHYHVVLEACGDDFERAERWLFRMRALGVEPTAETYRCMIAAARHRGLEAAQEWFERARAEGIAPDLGMYKEVLRAIEANAVTIKAEVWLEQMMLAGFKPDTACINLIIGTFAKAGRLPKVREWMAIMEMSLGLEPDVRTFTIALSALSRAGAFEEAEALMQDMSERGIQPTADCFLALLSSGDSPREHQEVQKWATRLKDVEMDSSAYLTVLGALMSHGDHRGVDEWYQRMFQDGKATADALAMDIEVLHMYAGEGGMELAKDRIDEWMSLGGDITQSIYAALAVQDVSSGNFEQVEMHLQQMEASGLTMNEDSVTCLLLAYANASPPQTELAEQLFKQHMLRGKLKATRPLLEALKFAVGGSRCLALRRELKLADQGLAGPDAVMTATDQLVVGDSLRKQRPRYARPEHEREERRAKLKWA